VASPWLTNAEGVCEIRRGNVDRAVQVLRNLVMDGNGILMRLDLPVQFRANFAAAMLASGNVAGCLQALSEIKEQTHPAVQSVRRVLTQWKESLSLWQRISFHLGGEPSQPLPADAQLGYL
jgi:hypothetical protein